MKTKILTAALTLASISAMAQTSVLDNYIQEGLKNNLQLKQEQLNYERSVENLAQAKALFLPYVGANATYQYADGGRKINFPIGDLLNPLYMSAGSSFRVSNQNINFLANDFHDTKIRVIQPIFNPEIYFNYKAQKELITVQQAQKKTYENQLKYEITSAYFQYLQADEALRILNNTRSILGELLKINQSLVANAKATKDVVLNTEYEINKIDQQIADNEKNHQVAQAYFNFLLNREMETSIIRDSTLSVAVSEQQEVSSLTDIALKQRQELQQLQNGLRANQQLIGLSKGNAFLPKINVVGDAGYQGFYYKFNSDQRYWLVQFGLTWDIFKGGEKRAKTQQARIDYQVTENKMEQLKKQIELQVIQSHYELESAKQAYKASQSGMRSAEKSFQIIRAKYNEGQAILLEYLDAQNKYTTSQLTNSINQYELLRKSAALQKTINNL
jgi:outer membrane protein TolC